MESYEMNENQKKTYTYGKHMFILAKFNPVAIVICFLFLSLNLSLIHNWIVTLVLSLVIIELFFMNFYYRKFTSMKLSMDETGIQFDNDSKSIHMEYKEIREISSKRFSTAGGWITIISNSEEKITLTIAMKDFGDFIKRLHEYLITNEREDLANNPLLHKAYCVATFADHDYRRVSYFGVKVLVYLVLSTFVARILPSFGFNESMLAVYVSILLFSVGFLMLEYFHFQPKLMKEMKESGFKVASFDDKSEKRMINILMITSVLIHLILTGILLLA